jgi:hypothetical protein
MSRLPIFASLLAVTASCTGGDEIWLPPSSTGKADGVSILDGADIPSQYVDATKRYLTGRSLASLRTVGALTGVMDTITARADGIIANLPANGRLEAAELVRMEDPSIFATLFADEKAALPRVWPHLLAPANVAIKVASPAGELTATATRTEPSGLTQPALLQISTLPADLQTVAKRVELVHNADNATATIHVSDIESVIAMPQAFTQDEIQQLREILAVFHARATSAADAKAVVPAPGHSESSTAIGGLTLELEADITIREQRGSRKSDGFFDWTGRLDLEQRLRATMTGGDSVILLQLGTDAENVLTGASAEVASLAASDYVVERYSAAGKRLESHLVTMPAFKSGEVKSDISELIDYDLRLANNTALIKNATETTSGAYGSGSQYRAVFEYATTQHTNPNASTIVVDILATPQITLPTGRYKVRDRNGTEYVLDIYPQNVVIAGAMRDGNVVNRTRMLFSTGGYPSEKGFTASPVYDVLVFVPATNRLYVQGNYVSVSSAMRVQ